MVASGGGELLELRGVLQDGSPYTFPVARGIQTLASSERSRLLALPQGPSGTPAVVKLPAAQDAPDIERLRREVGFAHQIAEVASAAPRGLFLPPVPYVGAGLEAVPHVFTEWVVGRSSLRLASVEPGVASLTRGGELLRWLAALVERVVALHDLGIVHRDIKPGNVLVTSCAGELDPGSAWLIDLGHAASFVELPTEPLTTEGHVVGTAGWMSPEQALGHEPDPCFDVFAVALLCLWIARGGVGSQCFPLGGSRGLERKLNELRKSVEEVRPRSLKELLLTMLDDKENRPDSREVAEALEGPTGTPHAGAQGGGETSSSGDELRWPKPEDWQSAADAYDRLAIRAGERRSGEPDWKPPPDPKPRLWERPTNVLLAAIIIFAVVALVFLRGAV